MGRLVVIDENDIEGLQELLNNARNKNNCGFNITTHYKTPRNKKIVSTCGFTNFSSGCGSSYSTSCGSSGCGSSSHYYGGCGGGGCG